MEKLLTGNLICTLTRKRPKLLKTVKVSAIYVAHNSNFKQAYIMKKFEGEDRLPAATAVDHESQDSMYCAICLSDICGGDSYRELPDCSHCFHADCIDAWFRSHSTCPLCRTQVPQIITVNEEDQYQWGALLSSVLLLFQNLAEKMCNPLNDELSSMLCDSVRCIS